MTAIQPSDRLIFALDVPSPRDALRLIDELDGVVSFYKVGLELLLAGGLDELLERLSDKKVFVDLKLPGDIGETIRRVVDLSVTRRVRFLTLSASAGPSTLKAARAARGASPFPKFLMVPLISSLDATDIEGVSPEQKGVSLDAFLTNRSRTALDDGCDGLIVSGAPIAVLRGAFPEAVIVSPGIRPAGSGADDHKRHTTPAEAIRMGADYLVVGRPIRDAGSAQGRRDAAQRIVDEIANASGTGH